MPIQVKMASIALVLSCLSTLTAVYFDGMDNSALSFSNPGILVTNIIWAAIIMWLVFDLVKKKANILLALRVVLIIMLAFAIWDYVDYGFTTSLLFYIAEISFFVIAIILLSKSQLKSWYAK